MSKKRTTLVVAFVVMGVAALGLAAAVYAKYVSSVEKTGVAKVAKWAFTTKNTTGSVECELDKTYNPNTLVGNRIAPGTSGYCPIVVSNEDTEVGITYSIVPGTVDGKPTNLKFYKDSTHKTELTAESALTGNLNPGAVTTTQAYVYWEWKYEGENDSTYDTNDTTDGVAAATMTMTFNVTGTQVQPAAN